MNTTAEPGQEPTPAAPKTITIPVTELVKVVWARRRMVLTVTGIGMVIAFAIAMLIPKEYQSSAELMPPDQQALSNPSMLAALSGQVSISSVAGAGGLLSARTPGATSIGILKSRTAQDAIINRFDLRRVYHRKLYVDTRSILEDRTSVDEDKKNGLIDITVTDEDPYRARDIARAYIDELNKILNSSTTSSARREREFLEGRLQEIKAQLDQSSVALSQFSSRNATLDYQKQGEATVEAAAKLQGELTTAQSELSGLKAVYSEDNMRVKSVEARIGVLRSQLQKMSGSEDNSGEATPQSGQLLPSIRQLPLLGATYFDLYRQVAMQETIYETLTKQYELAKVQEAKEIPAIKVLDEPDLAERKSFPHRSLIVLFGAFASACGAITWLVVCALWKRTH